MLDKEKKIKNKIPTYPTYELSGWNPKHISFFRPNVSKYWDTKKGKRLSQMEIEFHNLPYFLGYKTDFFSFQNNPKDLDLSYKTDLDLWDCLGRVKLVL